jgi:predicted DsbA family dithiol-disulfide isomerase
MVSEVAHKAMLFARTQGLALPFIKSVYRDGWHDGWRSYDMEDFNHLRGSLETVGMDVREYESFMTAKETDDELSKWQTIAEESGAVGVPHYSFEDKNGTTCGLFGREHLSLIRLKLHNEGLARNPDVRPEFPHTFQVSV